MESKKNTELGKRLRNFRKSKKITIAEISKACNIATSHLSYVERGICSISLSKLETITEFIGCDTIWLLTGSQSSDQEMKKLLKYVANLSLDEKHKLRSILQIEGITP